MRVADVAETASVDQPLFDRSQTDALPQQRPLLGLWQAPAPSGPGDAADAGDAALGPWLRLGEFFEAFVLPVCLLGARRRNVDQYRQTLSLWARLTGDPPLTQIDERLLAEFVGSLAAQPGRGQRPMAANTIRKHCAAIQYLLDRAGPRDRRSPRGRLNQNLLPEVPLVPKPALVVQEVRNLFTLPEISCWLAACRQAPAPRLSGVAPADWWLALILVAYNTGLRIETLLSLRYDWCSRDELGTWLVIPAAALKGRSRGRSLWLNAVALGQIEGIRRAGRELVFGWPYSESYLHQVRRGILAESALPPERHFGFHGLRKACATELAKLGSDAAGLVLGHSAGRSVTRDHYLHRSAMVAALRQLPQPTWEPPADPQLLLF